MPITVAQALSADYKASSMTLEELQVALSAAKQVAAIAAVPALMALITALEAAIAAYNAVITIIETLEKATPAIKLAVKSAAIPLNPTMAQEVAQDALQLAQKQIVEQLENAWVTAKDTLMNTVIPGT